MCLALRPPSGKLPVIERVVTKRVLSKHDQIREDLAFWLSRTPARFIGRQELVANKRAAGRLKDQADLEALGEP